MESKESFDLPPKKDIPTSIETYEPKILQNKKAKSNKRVTFEPPDASLLPSYSKKTLEATNETSLYIIVVFLFSNFVYFLFFVYI
jgi:hypothetical protein